MTAVSRSFWGNLIRQLRNDAGLTQRRLAQTARVNRSTLRAIEAGNVAGDITVIERLLAVFGYELEALDVQNLSARTRQIKVKGVMISLPKVG